MDSGRLKTPKTDFLVANKKVKKSISMDSKFVNLENTGLSTTLT